MEYYTAMLVQEAEKLYNKLVKDLVNRAIDDESLAAVALYHQDNNNQVHLLDIKG
jgi:hypothetical protein